MMYATLSEVYGKNFGSQVGSKKKKKKTPLETREMETRLLTRDDMAEFKIRNTPESRISKLGIDPNDPYNNN